MDHTLLGTHLLGYINYKCTKCKPQKTNPVGRGINSQEIPAVASGRQWNYKRATPRASWGVINTLDIPPYLSAFISIGMRHRRAGVSGTVLVGEPRATGMVGEPQRGTCLQGREIVIAKPRICYLAQGFEHKFTDTENGKHLSKAWWSTTNYSEEWRVSLLSRAAQAEGI